MEDEDVVDALVDTVVDEPDVMMEEEVGAVLDGDINSDNMSESTLDLNDDDDDDGGDDRDDDGTYVPEEVVEVLKAQWSEATVQTPEMAELGICVDTTARVVVCLACSSVVKPSELAEHLKRLHPPISASTSLCERLAASHELHEDPLGSRPGAIITAIYGLDLVPDCFTCDTCGYASKSKKEKSMREHIRKSQGCKAFRQRYAQTFQPTSGRMYFGVDLNAAVDVDEDPLDAFHYLQTKFAPPPFRDIPITSPESSCDSNHFLTLEPWLTLIEGKTGAELNDFVREREPELREEVRICVERFAQTAGKGLGGVDDVVRVAMGDYLG